MTHRFVQFSHFKYPLSVRVGEGESELFGYNCVSSNPVPWLSHLSSLQCASKKLDTVSDQKLHGWWEGLGMRLLSCTDQHVREKEGE